MSEETKEELQQEETVETTEENAEQTEVKEETLEEKIAALEEQLKSEQEKYLRVHADFENIKRCWSI